MNSCQKYFSAGLLALLTHAAFAAATAPSLGAAAAFEVLGGTNVTCTAGSVVAGDVGVSPGSAVSFTNTGCTISGATPPATNAAAVQARANFLSAYTALRANACTRHFGASDTLSGLSLGSGVYCFDAGAALAGTLTLTGAGPWIFKVEGALTGTNFSVVMAGGEPCNVYWAPSAAVTMTTSALKGNILAGNATDGSITLTGGTVVGRILANQAVTMTGASVIGCGVLAGGGGPGGGSNSCKGDDRDDDDGDRDHNKDKKGHKNPFGKDDDRDGKDGKKKK